MQSSHKDPERRLCILLVEDDPLIGMLLAEMLADMGHLVCSVADTEAGAVLAALEHRPDLMIVDARLGEGSGVRAVADILVARFVPHLFMSGNLDLVRRLRPDAVMLQKPFDEPALVRAIQQAMTTPRPPAPGAPPSSPI